MEQQEQKRALKFVFICVCARLSFTCQATHVQAMLKGKLCCGDLYGGQMAPVLILSSIDNNIDRQMQLRARIISFEICDLFNCIMKVLALLASVRPTSRIS